MQTGLHIALSVIWLAVVWRLTHKTTTSAALTLGGMIAAIIAVVLAAQPVWIAIARHYPQDSYWTLALPGRVGVAAISAIGITAIYLVMASKTRWALIWKPERITHTAWALCDVAINLLIFGVFYSISPQVFYAFYLWIFDGLEQQWVINTAFDIAQLRRVATFSPDGSLADHLAGTTLWAILPFTAWLHLRHWWQGKH